MILGFFVVGGLVVGGLLVGVGGGWECCEVDEVVNEGVEGLIGLDVEGLLNVRFFIDFCNEWVVYI